MVNRVRKGEGPGRLEMPAVRDERKVPGKEERKRPLIGRVRVKKTRVLIGEPVPIKVFPAPSADDEARFTIFGLPGTEQCLQFGVPGKMRIPIMASKGKGWVERRLIEIEVVPRLDERDTSTLFPIIHCEQDFRAESGVVLRLGNPEAFAGRSISCVWDLGDGIRMTSSRPELRYSFADRLRPGERFTTFDVRLHVKTVDGGQTFTGRRTMAVWNAYELDKRKGLVRPKVESDHQALRFGKAFRGRYRITNREREPIRFESFQFQALHEDPDHTGLPSRPEPLVWTLGPGETQERTFDVPRERLPEDAFGFLVHLRGRTERTGLTAAAALCFEVRANGSSVTEVRDPALLEVLQEFPGRGESSRGRVIDADRLALAVESTGGTILPGLRIALPGKPPTPGQDERSAGRAPDRVPRTLRTERPTEGDECTPEDEENAMDGYACQLTDEVKWVYIPARILNARKGDVILSPGGGGPIGGLLQKVSPPQVFSHSGIMVDNHYHLRHSTTSDQWLIDSAKDDGFHPSKLKYGWPGTITQTVAGAFDGQEEPAPEGEQDDHKNLKRYVIKGFSNESTLIGGIAIVDPVVVKPDPQIEWRLPEIRERLHSIAEFAKDFKGHYRFFAYTRADIVFDAAFQAPQRDGWWASNTLPTVCSSMIWAAVKSVEGGRIPIEGMHTFTRPSDLEPEDVVDGAQVDYLTRDGLYYYTEEERRTAAEWLNCYVHNLAYAVAGWSGELLTDASDDTANQICNTFAFDWAGEDEAGNESKDSERWRNPLDGRAVSPDDIWNYWDAPGMVGDRLAGLYGFSEKLIYRPARFEQRRVSRWIRVETEATLSGRVVYGRTGASVGGALVRVAGRETLTDGSGDYSLKVPAGTYRIDAGAVIDGWHVSGSQVAAVSGGESRTINLLLQDPPEAFREITVRGTMHIVDDEWGKDETANRGVFMSGIRLGPSDLQVSRFQSEGMGGEIRVELFLVLAYLGDASVNVRYTAKLFEGTSEDTDDLEDEKTGELRVPKDATEPLTIRLANQGVGGGDTADISLQISNERQP